MEVKDAIERGVAETLTIRSEEIAKPCRRLSQYFGISPHYLGALSA